MDNTQLLTPSIDKVADRQVWGFISLYIFFQFSSSAFLYYARDNFSPIFSLRLAMFDIFITWIPLLFLPVLIRYRFKKILTKKWAIIYTIVSLIVFMFGNIIIDLYYKSSNPDSSTTTIWNLLMLIIPYYLLSNSRIFSFGQKKQ